MPEGYTAVSVTGGDVADFSAESAASGGYRALKVVFGRAVEGRELVQLRLEKNQGAAAGDWALAPLRFPGAKTVRGHIGVVATPGYRIAPERVDRLAEVPLSYFPIQVAGLQQAWRLREPEWSADVRIQALGQSVQADVFHLYSIKEGIVYGSVLLNYFVVGAPATEWRIELPASVGNVDVAGQNVQRDWRREGNLVIVSLHQPVLGASTLLVTFEQPMSARGGTIEPGQVHPLGVQSERGYIEVVSPLQVRHEVLAADGLLKLEPTELPAEFRLLSTSPALAVYQYTARPFSLRMGVRWYEAGEPVDQVVDFARLSSQVSRDGQVVTHVQYFVKTRGRKALRLILPAGMKLWETRVDGQVANAQIDGEQTLVPLPARLNPNEPASVELSLGQEAVGSGALVRLEAPRALAPAVITEWTLRGEPGLQLVPRGGTAELGRPASTETGFEWIGRRKASAVAALLCVAALGGLLLRSSSGWGVASGLLFSAAAVGATLMLASEAVSNRRTNSPELTYAATMLAPGEGVSVVVGNGGSMSSLAVGWGLACAAAGAALALLAGFRPAANRRHSAVAVSSAAVPVAAGLLAQHGGAALFFSAVGAGVFVFQILPGARRLLRRGPQDPLAGGAPAMPLLAALLATGVALGGAQRAFAEEGPAALSRDGTRPVQSMEQSWSIRNDRLFAEVELTVRAAAGDSFLLLRPPATLSGFQGEDCASPRWSATARRPTMSPPSAGGSSPRMRGSRCPCPTAQGASPRPRGPPPPSG